MDTFLKIRRPNKATGALKRGTVGGEIVGVDGGDKCGGGYVLKVIPWQKPQQTPRSSLHVVASFLNA